MVSGKKDQRQYQWLIESQLADTPIVGEEAALRIDRVVTTVREIREIRTLVVIEIETIVIMIEDMIEIVDIIKIADTKFEI
uniref:Uncharacterized protein n=1 Tax=Caenorhabditis tropicalis TaxID=1561998 RepID=A0A1I7TG06_9PELO